MKEDGQEEGNDGGVLSVRDLDVGNGIVDLLGRTVIHFA